MAIVTIKEGIMMIQGIEKAQFTLIFVANRPHAYKTLCVPRRQYPRSFD